MKIVVPLSLIFFMTANIGMAGSLDEQRLNVANKAINDNDSGKLKKLLTDNSINSEQASCLLGNTLFASAHETNKKCRTEIVSILLEKGAVPSEEHRDCMFNTNITDAFASQCPDVIKLIVDHAPKDQLPDAAIYSARAIKFSDPSEFFTGPEKQKTAQDARQKTVDTISVIKGVLQPICEKQGDGSSSCDALADLKGKEEADSKHLEMLKQANAESAARVKTAEQAEADEKKEQALAETPVGLERQACQVSNSIKQADQAIAHENEVGKAAGYVNKATLHDDGQWKVASQHQLVELKSKYRQKTGHDLNLKNCKIEKLNF